MGGTGRVKAWKANQAPIIEQENQDKPTTTASATRVRCPLRISWMSLNKRHVTVNISPLSVSRMTDFRSPSGGYSRTGVKKANRAGPSSLSISARSSPVASTPLASSLISGTPRVGFGWDWNRVSLRTPLRRLHTVESRSTMTWWGSIPNAPRGGEQEHHEDQP